ncbi:MAG: NADH-quinone oxidoreductase subunit NuoH [Thermoleophilia bacterium]
MSQLLTFALGLLLGAVAFAIVGALTTVMVLAERKVGARIQARVGPMYTGPHGSLQTVADIVKLVMKEDVRPTHADTVAFRLGPLLVAVPAILSLAVIPFGAPLIMRDLNVGVLYFLAVPGVTVVGLLLAGWASYDNYSFLGGLRSSAQFISYEIPRGLAVVTVVMLAGSLSTVDLLEAQSRVPYILLLPLSFFIYAITSLAEVNRVPFDIPEAESELVAGYHTEYSGFRWALFFLAEYAGLFAASAFGALLFLGGGNGPLLPGVVWLLLKTGALMFVSIWIRFTLPRFRADQLMRLAWKFFLPLSLVNLVIAALVMRAVA